MRRLALLLMLSPGLAPADIPADTQIVILGEVHDNADAHLGQAKALAALNAKAVVFEMLTPEAAELASDNRDALPDIWAGSGWPDYAIYAPIFDAMGGAAIVGAATTRATNRAVFIDGAVAHFGEEAARFGLTEALPEAEQVARETLQFTAHCEAMPRAMMPSMVEVQRFRDARFAQAALNALDTFGAPVALITGNGHARTDWGVPAMIAQAAPDIRTYAIAFTERPTDTPYDEVRIVPEPQREDPCAAFKTD